MLRTEAGRSPHDKALSNLIGELSTRSEHFRTWWAAHNVRFHRTGVKRFRHPVVGDLTLTFEALDLAADEGLRISAYTAEPGTPSDDALKLLASWAATLDQADHSPGRSAASASALTFGTTWTGPSPVPRTTRALPAPRPAGDCRLSHGELPMSLEPGPERSRPASGPTRSSRSRPTPSCGSCWAACAGRTCGTTEASRRTRPGRSGMSSSASSNRPARSVRGIRAGDLVVAPFIYSDMTCPHCLNGSTISCPAGGSFGNGVTDGGQGEAVRVPPAAWDPRPVPGSGHPDDGAAVAARAVRRRRAPGTTRRPSPA